MEVFSTVVSFLSDLLSDFMDVASRYWWVSAVLVLPLVWFLLAGLIGVFTSVRLADSVKYRNKYFGLVLQFCDDMKAQRREEARLLEKQRREEERRLEKQRREEERRLEKQRREEEEQLREKQRYAVALDHFEQFKNAAYVDVDGKRYWRDGIDRHKVRVGFKSRLPRDRRTTSIIPNENNIEPSSLDESNE